MNDQFNLQRFVEAQSGSFENVLDELRCGSKRSHWIWFIFPQLRGLGRSETAHHYGISSRQEAQAYLKHPILGPRLVECVALVNRAEGRSAEEIFGSLDSMKFRSSLTLFAEVDKEQPEFTQALQKFFGGRPDKLTIDMLSQQGHDRPKTRTESI